MKKLSPSSITLIYLLFGILWIATSDRAVEGMVSSTGLLTRLQTMKGWLFVFFTGGILFLLTNRLVSQITSADKAKKQQEKLFEKYFTLGQIGMAFTSPEKGWVHVNDLLCRMLGYSREEILSTTWDKLTHPDDLAPDLKQFQRLLDGEIEHYDLEKRFIRKNGDTVATHLYVSCIRREDRSIEYVIAHIQDIRDRKKAEMDLLKSSQILNDVQAVSLIGTWEHHIRTGTFYFSEQAERNLGFPGRRDKATTDIIKQRIHPDYRNYFDEQMNVLHQSGSIEFEFPILLEDGKIRWIWMTGRLSCNDDKQPTTMSGLLQDITKLKETENELRKLTRQLEQKVEDRTVELKNRVFEVEKLNLAMINLADDLKEKNEQIEKTSRQLLDVNNDLKEFAYIVSHDLKAPLRGASQLAYWISTDYSDKLDDAGREKIDLLLNRVKRMDALINGILTYSRIGRIREKQEEINTKLLVRKIIDTLSPPDTIKFEVDSFLPVLVAEKTRIEQLFQNLIDNSIKFMDKPRGLIRIGCEKEGMFWKFRVTDNGPGIDPRYHDTIFKIFQSLESRDTRESTGIGLTLAKKIVSLYGGRIWIESEKGSGTTFFFTLPAKREDS
ncbi:MAG: PAS domain S-box protein [Pseudomonadota bacterium]